MYYSNILNIFVTIHIIPIIHTDREVTVMISSVYSYYLSQYGTNLIPSMTHIQELSLRTHIARLLRLTARLLCTN